LVLIQTGFQVLNTLAQVAIKWLFPRIHEFSENPSAVSLIAFVTGIHTNKIGDKLPVCRELGQSVEVRKQLSNHLEEDIQLLINFESSLKFD